jgi:hypothetical protein
MKLFNILSRSVGRILIISIFLACKISAQNNALDFDGSSDKVNINHSASLSFGINDKFSIEAWFKTSTSYYRIIVSKLYDNYPFRGYEMKLSNGKINFSFTNTYPSSYIDIFTVNSFNDGNWHHVACVYHGIPNANNVDIYVDGVLQSKTIGANSLSGVTTSTDLVTIASRQGVNAYNFQGPIDEVRIWRKALCAQEITARKNCHLVGNEYGLVAYYNFNIGTAGGNNSTVTTLPDLTAYNNTGTLSTFALTGSTSNWVSSTAPVSGTCSNFGALGVTGNTLLCTPQTFSTVLTASGAATYTWNSGITTASLSLTPTVTSNYTVVATDANTCVTSRTVNVSVSPTPTITINATPSVICIGQSGSLTASGASSYTWNSGSNFPTITISPTNNTSYSASGTSTAGCVSGVTTITVTASPPPTISVNSGTICSGSVFTITPTGAVSYTISGGSSTVSPGNTTTYTITGSNAAGCISQPVISTVSVNSGAIPSISISGNTVICEGATTSLLASGSAVTYTWSTGATGNLTAVSPTLSTIYSVTGAGTNGCTNTATVFVFVNSKPNVTAQVTSTSVCTGDPVTLNAGGAASYAWSGGVMNNVAFYPSATNVYSVTGTATNSCKGTATIQVVVNPLPTILITASSSSVCNGYAVTFTATGGNTYNWNTGQNTSSITVTPTALTNYTVTGTDANGCKNIAIISIFVDECVGISETGRKDEFLIFPNPFSSNINIDLNCRTDLRVEIYNSLSQLVKRTDLQNCSATISMNGNPDGIYFINIIESGMVIVRARIIKAQ